MAERADAEVHLRFVTEGADRAGRQLGELGQQVQKATPLLDRMQQRLDQLGRVARNVALGLGGTLVGFIRQGLQGTGEMQRFSYATQQAAFQLASVFAPQIRAVIGWVEKLAAQLRALTGEQQESIRNWVRMAATLAGLLVLAPRALALTRAGAALGAAPGLAAAGGMARLGLGTGTGAMIAGAGGVVGGIAGAAAGLLPLLAFSKEGREALAKLAAAALPLVEAFGSLAHVVVTVLTPPLKFVAEKIAFIADKLRLTREEGEEPSWTQMAVAGGAAILERLGAGVGGLLGIEGPAVRSSEEWLENIFPARAREKEKARETLTPAGGAVEQVTDLARRLATMKGMSPELKAMEDIKAILRGMKAGFEKAFGWIFSPQPQPAQGTASFAGVVGGG